MNIFVLHSDPVLAARDQCDKHVVKMIVESAQMLSTAHRLLDGTMTQEPRKAANGNWRRVKVWKLDDSHMDSILYAAAHTGHPCTKWIMESAMNYDWLYVHFLELCKEYEHRYGKDHATRAKLGVILGNRPKNIPLVKSTPFKLAMQSNPECMYADDPVRSYREFYQTKQSRFKMKWTKREVPTWFKVNP